MINLFLNFDMGNSYGDFKLYMKHLDDASYTGGQIKPPVNIVLTNYSFIFSITRSLMLVVFIKFLNKLAI